jgi:hypothetical protein
VRVDRAAAEFAGLLDVTAAGFAARGSGTMHVTTAPLYGPGETYVVEPGGHVRADVAGRLRVRVDLGPSNVYDQFTHKANVEKLRRGDGYFRTVPVRITPAQRS